jgi:hypothetical protein
MAIQKSLLKLALASLGASVLVVPAHARPYMYHHVLSCGDYLAQTAQSPPRQYAVAFVRGFISAHNAYNQRSQITRELSIPTMDAYIEKFCRENPQMDSGAAALSLVKEVGGAAVPNQ